MQQLTAFVTCKSKIIARIYVSDAFSLEINAFALFCFMVLIMESLKLEKKNSKIIWFNHQPMSVTALDHVSATCHAQCHIYPILENLQGW